MTSQPSKLNHNVMAVAPPLPLPRPFFKLRNPLKNLNPSLSALPSNPPPSNTTSRVLKHHSKDRFKQNLSSKTLDSHPTKSHLALLLPHPNPIRSLWGENIQLIQEFEILHCAFKILRGLLDPELERQD